MLITSVNIHSSWLNWNFQVYYFLPHRFFGPMLHLSRCNGILSQGSSVFCLKGYCHHGNDHQTYENLYEFHVLKLGYTGSYKTTTRAASTIEPRGSNSRLSTDIIIVIDIWFWPSNVNYLLNIWKKKVEYLKDYK